MEKIFSMFDIFNIIGGGAPGWLVFVMVFLAYLPILLIAVAEIVLRIVAAVRIQKNGGSGVGYFFLSWFYIILSSKAAGWAGFSQTHAVLAMFFPLGTDIYTLVKLPKNGQAIEGN